MPPPLTDELRDRLALTLVPGLGPKLTAAMLENFGSASAVRHAAFTELMQVPHVGEKLARQFGGALAAIDVDAEIERLKRFNTHLLALNLPGYPAALATIDDAPQLLYIRGEIKPEDANAVAIVGSRQCTPYGIRVTEKLAGGLARAGFTVVSGLARGIDGAAHQGALNGGGRTIAVLAGGLSNIYPPEHLELSRSVEASGALITETPMAMSPMRGMFHARNRLISGLSRAVVVVEANERSGALITARHAGEQGRDLFALPANVDSPSSAGSLKLIRDGARVIRHLDDLLEDLKGIDIATSPQRNEPPSLFTDLPKVIEKPAGLDPLPSRVWDYLTEPKHIDDITREMEISISEISRLLMSLEIKKIVRRLPGNQYERR